MKTRNRLLSVLLALVLCIGLITPALAEEAGNLDVPESGNGAEDIVPYADTVSLTAELLGTKDGALASANDTGRIRLKTEGQKVVVGEITYSIDDATAKDKVTLNEKTGEIKWADNYKPENDETVNVTVTYTYYSGNDVKYVENFDSNTDKPFTNTNYAINDGQSRTGQYGVTPVYRKVDNGALKTFDSALSDVRVTAWYYDPYDSTDKAYNADDQMKFGLGATPSSSNANTNFLGVFWGGSSEGSLDKYSYRNTKSGFVASEQKRSSGWHKLEWVVTNDKGTVMSIDGTEVATQVDTKEVGNLTLATNWCKQDAQKGMEVLYNRHYIDDISIVSKDATAQSGTATVTVQLKAPEAPKLTYGQGKADEVLSKGEPGRVYLDNMESYAIADVTYTTDNPNVKVDEAGNLTVTDGYAPKPDETVTVTAEVTYYDKPEDVVFSDSFEGEKQFGTPASYTHSTKNPLFGRHAATATTTKGPSDIKFNSSVNDVTVTAWYYDENVGGSAEGQTKFGFGILGTGENTMGIFFDGDIAPLVGNNTLDHYGVRVAGTTYGSFSWGGSDAVRSQGWHKFQWIISSSGMTAKIDDKVVSTHQGTVGDASNIPALTPVQDNAKVTSINGLRIADNWNDNKTNEGNIIDRHFIDGVTVVKNDASTKTMELKSGAIPVKDVQYTHIPETITVENSVYPKDVWLQVKPDLSELASIEVDGNVLTNTQTNTQWHVTTEGDAPKNASNYPTGELIVYADAFKGLTQGKHELALVMTSGSECKIPVEVTSNQEHTATSYYLSNKGKDSNFGNSEDQAWATFDKLSTVTFGPGDKIYLDAASTWNGVQFQPKGSGAEGAPIVITSYNNGGDKSKRPILNGSGTVAKKNTANGEHSYLAFDAWREFYPSGTIELFNVEYWEVRGIEITNYSSNLDQGATGRNGIAVIHDFFEVQGIETLPSGDQAREEAFYRAGKLQHITVEDCYIHDVNGYHPNNGATGRGSKMSGGINVYGPYDGLKLNNNIIMYCDVEGIRNDVLAWRGDTRTQFPCYMEDIDVSNNFIVGIPGDGVVLSSAIEPTITHNYLADAGYSYLSDGSSKSTAAKAMGNRDNPVIYKTANFAGLWFIGTMDAVAQFNESVNNVWTCNDGEAFDADMYTWGTVFQYNYTYRNNGGFALIMATADPGTIMRYNVSVEDGQGIGSSPDQDSTFHYAKAPDAIYNNLFVLGDKVESMFGGGANSTQFFNNIVIAPNGLLQAGGSEIGFHINGSSDGKNATVQQNPKLSGEMTNNIFYPAAIPESVVSGSTVTLTDNKVLTEEELDTLFHDLDGFMEAQPVNALKGRSTFDDFTTTTVTMIDGKGAGKAISEAEGRKASVPSGDGFDYAQFEGIKTVEGSPAIGAGIPVKLSWENTDKLYPLTKDFFQNTIDGTNPDIGPYQWSADASHYVKVTLDGNGADAQVAPVYAKVGGTVTLPKPAKTGSTFQGWYESADFSGSALTGSYNVSKSGITLYAKWQKDGNTCDVTFDTQGGSDVPPQNGLEIGDKVTKPADDPTLDGSEFQGWYKDAGGTTPWDFDNDTVTADTVIYAKWKAVYYTVTFDRNGGSTEANPKTKRVTLPAKTLGNLPAEPTRADHKFIGWNTAADGSGTAFTGDTQITGNMTVYAQWQKIGDVVVTFDSKGGSAVNAATVAAGQTAAKPADPTRDGYTFGGWYTDEDCTAGKEFDFSTPVANDMTLYAKWTEKTDPVTPGPGSGGGSGSGSDPNIITETTTNEDGSTTTTVTNKDTGTVTETTKNLDGSVEVTETKKDGTVTLTTTDPDGSEVKKVTTPEKDVTITASSAEGEVLAKVELPAELPPLETEFVDVPDGHWAEESINEIAALGIVNGVGDSRFDMTSGIKRGDLATIMFRMSNGKEGYDLQFTDVPKDKYYSDAVAWAARTGVVTGVSADSYAPEAPINREQLATMLYRYVKLLNMKTKVSDGVLDSFADKGSVHDWAADGMAWCVANGIIKGRGEDTLAPGAEASRAEVSVMLSRFIDLLK